MSDIKQFFLLQLHKTSRPVIVPMFLTFTINLLLARQPTCMSVIVASHQQICLNQFQLTCSTFVVVGLNQVYVLHLPQTRS